MVLPACHRAADPVQRSLANQRRRASDAARRRSSRPPRVSGGRPDQRARRSILSPARRAAPRDGGPAMTALAPVRSKLSALIPRLASNFDGEVVAVAKAIGRTLQNAGLDFHDLAKA